MCYNVNIFKIEVDFMKLSSSSEILAENKVLILYILDQIHEPVLDSTLLQVVSSVTDLNYFYFQQFLLDLLRF